MKVSIVIPVYNSQETIDACLESVTRQTGFTLGEDYEVVLVDDGSTDRTVERARNHPVRIVRLGKNSGRIVARLTGALEAKAERLLLVDSRVAIPPDTLSKLEAYDRFPAVMAVSSTEQRERQTGWDLIFYLIRRRYYGKRYFPLSDRFLLITKENFKRAPKGTTTLLIDKALFIRLTPERTGKGVSDDTLLLSKLVFDESVCILRTGDIVVEYTARSNMVELFKWLSHRGILFSDFYLAPGGYFHPHFLVATTLLGILLLSLFLSSLAWSTVFLMLLCGLLAIHLGVVLFLIETPRDFRTVFLRLPVILAVFGSGVARYWFRRLRHGGANAKK